MGNPNNPYGDQENPWQQQQPAAQPQQQQQPPRQQNPAPGQDPGWNVDAGGGKNWWETSAQEAGINPWQQDYKKEFERTNSQALAGMSPEQRARWSMEHIDDLSGNGSTWDAEKRWRQWMYWQDSFDANCPPNAPYQAEDGSGCVEKPDNSNKGYQEGGGGGPGGGGGGGGRGGGRGGAYGNPEIYNYLKGQAMDPKQWLNTFLGQGGMSQYQAQVDEQRKQAMLLPEPQRSAALARINEGTLGATRQQAEAARMGMLSGQMMPQEYQYGALAENARQANMQNALGWGGLNLQGELGRGQLGLSRDMFSWESGQKWQDTLAQNQLDRDLQKMLQKQQIDASKQPWWQKALGAIGGLAGAAGSIGLKFSDANAKTNAYPLQTPVGGFLGMSDVALKENVLPEGGALTALEKMPAYSYNYKWDPPEDRHIGIMAQDAEKVSPHLVKEVAGFKAVDVYGLLTVTMEAVKELNKKLESKGRKR